MNKHSAAISEINRRLAAVEKFARKASEDLETAAGHARLVENELSMWERERAAQDAIALLEAA
jgi:hypothetical protein